MRLPIVKPSWSLVGIVLLAFTKIHFVRDFAEILSLGTQAMLRRDSEAPCALCHRVVGIILKIADVDDIDAARDETGMRMGSAIAEKVHCDELCVGIGR